MDRHQGDVHRRHTTAGLKGKQTSLGNYPGLSQPQLTHECRYAVRMNHVVLSNALIEYIQPPTYAVDHLAPLNDGLIIPISGGALCVMYLSKSMRETTPTTMDFSVNDGLELPSPPPV